ncbi:MAG TPA: pyrroline-5-carboxylate reductase [Burkholderiales bacterium]|nr:pyrroline-5-carboxylate reductase [Burkholderiales bacterium]
MNITFIGGGNMAGAIIGGLLKKGWQPDAIRVAEIDAGARARLERELRVRVFADGSAAAVDSACIVFAVKPQHMREAAQALRGTLKSQLVITIAAGIRSGDLARWLGDYQRIVRAMPNTPALVLAGLSGLYAMPAVPAEDRLQAEKVMGAVGSTLWLAREEQMDAITAVSGSGPAYVFYFIEALQQAAAELGFTADEARKLALDTFAGAVKLAAHSSEDAATLRARVTSKGGTTERALDVLETGKIRQIIARAAHAAAERSRELGDEFGKD